MDVILPRKSATGWEGQIGRLSWHWCTLEGRYWKWKPWRRLTVQWWTPDENGHDTMSRTFSSASLWHWWWLRAPTSDDASAFAFGFVMAVALSTFIATILI